MFNIIPYLLFFVLLSDNDYYYGGSMRDLNNGYGRPRKSSSVSHLGEFRTSFNLSMQYVGFVLCVVLK